jgi:hypothetical protein
MPLFTPRPDADDPEDGDGLALSVPLDEHACPRCHRMLYPWQPTCPEDGAAAVPRTSLGALAPPPEHLLVVDEEEDHQDGSG